MTWFVYTIDNDFEEFPTADEAKRQANLSLSQYRRIAIDEGWPEETTAIRWGKVHGSTVETERRVSCPDEGDDPQFDEVVGYVISDNRPVSLIDLLREALHVCKAMPCGDLPQRIQEAIDVDA